jgi:hypothetical protein
MVETTKYTLGLTATPIVKMVWATFSHGLSVGSYTGKTNRYEATRRPPDTSTTAKDSMQLDYSGRPDTVAMISDLCNNADRTQDIADMAIKVLKDPQRCVLVLSERRKHLEDIKLLEPDHGHEMGFYVGGMKASERRRRGTPESSWRRFLRRKKGLTCPD